MATTAHYGWPKSNLTDQPNGPAQLNAAIDAIDTTLDVSKVGPGSLLHNTGLVLTAASGWGSLDYYWQIRNGWMSLLIEVARTGSTITALSNGNVSNTLMATLGSNLPPMQIPSVAYLVTVGASGSCVLYNGSGQLILISTFPSGTISAGDIVRSQFAYPV